VHRIRCFALVALLGLAACATAPVPSSGPFRTEGAPIYSSAVLQTDRMTGRWHEVGSFATLARPGCRPGGAEIASGPHGSLQIMARLCLEGRSVPVAGALQPVGPGRFALRGADPAGIGQPWWVLWADDGYRTLVIGTPSGTFGIVLNRTENLPPDRRRAVVEILDWNGYDTARLVFSR